MGANETKDNKSGATINQVADYLNYLQPYQGEKREPDVSDMSKDCAIAIRSQFLGFEGMLHSTNMYFHFYENEDSEYAQRISMAFDVLSEYIYSLIVDIVETKFQSNWSLFIHTLTSESFRKSRTTYSEFHVKKIHSYFDRECSIEGLKKLVNTGSNGEGSLGVDIKAELIYVVQYSLSGKVNI